MKRAFITGGMGFVGTNLLRHILLRGDTARVFDNLSTSSVSLAEKFLPPEMGFELLVRDVRNLRHLRSSLEDVDIIYHLASHVGIEAYLDDPIAVADVLVNGTLNVIRAAIEKDIQVVFLSTSELYGKNPELPWAEEADSVLGDPARERWVYARAKSLCEHMLYGAARQQGLKFVTLRLFNLYGPGQPRSFFVAGTLWRLSRGEPAVIFDEGEQVRCFTFIDDAIQGILKAADDDSVRNVAINIGADSPLRVSEATQIMQQHFGTFVAPVYKRSRDVYGERFEDPASRIPDVTRARQLLGWRPSTNFKRGVSLTLEWVEKHGWWFDEAS